MKVSNQFVMRKIADECLLIPVGEAAMSMSGLIALSESGALLFEKLQDSCTEAELLEVLLAEYDVDPETAKADLDAFLEKMRQLSILLEEDR